MGYFEDHTLEYFLNDLSLLIAAEVAQYTNEISYCAVYKTFILAILRLVSSDSSPLEQGSFWVVHSDIKIAPLLVLLL